MELIHQLSNSTMKILRLPSSFSQSSVSLDFDTARILPLSLRILRWSYEPRMPGLFGSGLIRYHPHFLRRREALLCSRVTPIGLCCALGSRPKLPSSSFSNACAAP